MTKHYYLSIDWGALNDYTAIVILEVENGRGSVVHLQRLELGTPYPAQVDTVKGIYSSLQMFRLPITVVSDTTGIGRPISDLLNAAGIQHIALTITGGTTPTKTGNEWHVPKRDLVSSLLVALQSDLLKISHNLTHAVTLTNELQNFKIKVKARTGHDSYEAWRESDHDDMLLATAQACYCAGIGRPPERAVSRPRPDMNTRGIPVKPKPGIGFFEPRNRSRGIIGL
jgi:hypothetical protein